MTSKPSRMARTVTARMAGLRPGTSPPPVRMPMRPALALRHALASSLAPSTRMTPARPGPRPAPSSCPERAKNCASRTGCRSEHELGRRRRRLPAPWTDAHALARRTASRPRRARRAGRSRAGAGRSSRPCRRRGRTGGPCSTGSCAGSCPCTVLTTRDDVADDGRGRRHAAGAGAEQHDLVEGVALEEDGVVGAGHAGQRMRGRQEGRVHAHVHAAVDELGDAEQLADAGPGACRGRCRRR